MYKINNRRVKSADFILPAPVGGLNKRDPLVRMDLTDAIEMDNYMPTENSVELREGYERYVRLGDFSNTKKIETLACYNTAEHKKMIAVFDGKAFDVSTTTATQYQNVSFTKSRCQTVQYRGHLYFMNGVDKPKVYYIDDENVEHFENWGFEGEDLPENQIVSGGVSHEFLWFVEKKSTKAWVSSVAGNVAGSLECFDVAQVLKWGGELQNVFNWTIDGGQGIDDYTCLLSSEGEVLVYKGYNPNDADHWSLVGSYKLSKPLGFQCVLPYRGDVIVMTEDGYLPLSASLSWNNAGFSSVAFSDKIRGLVLERAKLYQFQEGWQALIYGKKGFAIFNVPIGNGFEQHVININTGAWCRWTNIRAFCWCIYDSNLYFGSDNVVFKFGNVHSDDGLPIEAEVEQAYADMGTNTLKKIALIKPRIKSSKDFKLMIWTNMDFEQRNLDYYVNIGGVQNEVPKWGTNSKWGNVKWGSLQTHQMQGQWLANNATGFKASVVFKTKTAGNKIEWFETGLRVEKGTGVL